MFLASTETSFLGLGGGLLAVTLGLTESFYFVVLHLEELFRVLNSLVNGGYKELSFVAKVSVYLSKAPIEHANAIDDLSLANFELSYLLVEVNLQFVDGPLKENHLLALLRKVDSLILWHGIVVPELELKVAIGLLGKNDLLAVLRVLA